jgi:N-acetylglucosamine kinase-like BadF-type ATPase
VYVLGVDGGGTKTTARVLESRSGTSSSGSLLCVLGSGHSSGSNPLSVGWESAQRAIETAVAEAVEAAGVRPDRAVLAVAGCATPAARDRLAAWATKAKVADDVQVVPDTAPLLAAVASGEAAIGLIAGTGSSTVVRRPDGSTEVVGGWGYLIDDAGSGYALGRDALRHAARHDDAGDGPNSLTQALLAAAGVARPPELKGIVYGASDPRRRVAEFAPLVVLLAEREDALALEIVQSNTASLAELAVHAAARLGSSKLPAVFLGGGLACRSPFYRRRLLEELCAHGWEQKSVLLAPDAASACGLIALRSGG